MVLLVAGMAIVLFFMMRSILIMFGYFKEPILHTFQEYGPVENLYLPGLPIMAWAGVLAILISMLATPERRLTLTAGLFGIALLLATYFAYQNYELVSRWHFRFLPYPRWYYDLRERTTRYERRRIAYMWLHLPWKLRLIYNSSDYWFNHWADFVIMGTIRDEETNVKEEEYYYMRQ